MDDDLKRFLWHSCTSVKKLRQREIEAAKLAQQRQQEEQEFIICVGNLKAAIQEMEKRGFIIEIKLSYPEL